LDTTESSFIDGEIGKLLYRGYNIHDLAEKSNFQEASYLLLYGALPNADELQAFKKRLRENRALPPEVIEIIRRVQKAHPMDVLRTAVSALSAFDPETEDMSREANLRKSERLTAKFPTIVAAHHRIRQGLEPVEPRSDLDHAANFLYMLQGSEPSEEAWKAMDLDFLLHAEHGANAPRARHMREKSHDRGAKLGHEEWYQILTTVEEEMKPYQSRGIFVNVDFYAGSVYYLLGMPEDLFIPIFAIGRIPGWCVEILEQYDNNMLIRPLLKYTGPMDLEYTPIDKR